MTGFVDRKDELDGLDRMYSENDSALFILYGRRRIGKTELAEKFMKDKEGFYFLSRQQDLELEAERFKNEFGREFDSFIESEQLENVIDEAVDKLEGKPVMVIDEFPYWIQEDKSIVSIMQGLWDEKLSEKEVFLILTGSSISMMETEVLDYKSPLYGRRKGQLKLDELPLHTLNQFFPEKSFEEQLKIYGATGMIPHYLKEFKPEKDFFQNIEGTFLNDLHLLNEEAEILLREELRKPNKYFNIMEAIIDGKTKPNTISQRVNIENTNISKYLNKLEQLELIKKESPITMSEKPKNRIYKVSDHYFRFWLRYVYKNQSDIQTQPEKAIQNIRNSHSKYMGEVFEEVCQKTVRKNREHTKVGRWWYKQHEIDIVALNEKEEKILFGECKWTNQKVGMKLLKDLEDKSEKVRWQNQESREEEYALFSKSGFEDKLKMEAEGRDDLQLYDLNTVEQVLAN